MLGLRHYRGGAIDIWQGDITTFSCDAIVNASDPALTPGGGVSGAIHRVGGSTVTDECAKIGPINTGDAIYTSGGDLPARYVIHTSGPIWRGGDKSERLLLVRSYANSLLLAESLQCRHIAFPALSAGIYGYPLDEAAQVAMYSVKQSLDLSSFLYVKRISFTLFDKKTYQSFQSALFSTFAEDFHE